MSEKNGLDRLTNELAILFERYGTAVNHLRTLIETEDAIDECVTSDDCVSPPYEAHYRAKEAARAWLEKISGE